MLLRVNVHAHGHSGLRPEIVDTVVTGTLATVYGRDPRTKSPWEILVGWHEAELMMTAAKRAGREGISIGCVENASSDIPQLSANSRGLVAPSP